MELVLAMPGEMVLVWPVVAVSRKQNTLSGKSLQKEAIWAGFVEPTSRNDDFVIVGQRPKSLVEEPMRVLTERNAVLRMVVPAVRKLVDVRGIYNASRPHSG